MIEHSSIIEQIPSEALMKLDQVKMFLNRGKASVMVGAGFSKNAYMMEFVSMKDWNELSRAFFDQLFIKENDKENNSVLLHDSLKLAQMYECSFGRNALDTLIQDALPNESTAPGKLHELLMKLSWHDVFTTNYDTLLEKAALDSGRGYQVVTNKETLLYADSPRIIKLHGSFPNNRPFIITEEDFRSYPQRHPEFVNTVRQALMENLFCLFGFSGNDPNFLQWMGWLRDVMGNQVSPAYLITYEPNLHKAQQDLFKGRGIEIINIATFGDDISYSEGLEIVLEYLATDTLAEWKPELNIGRVTSVSDVVEATKKMREIREQYPQYLYLPKQYHSELSDIYPLRFGQDETVLSNLSLSQRIHFIYEIVWRYEVALSPILVPWVLKEMENLSFTNEQCEASDKYYLNEIQMALLTILRIHGEDERFEELVKILEKQPLIADQKHKYFYEQCIRHLGILNYQKVQSVLSQWDVSGSEVKSALWKAVVLSEIGQDNEAINLLNITNQRFRQSLLTKGAYQQIAVTYSNALEDALTLLETQNPIDTSLVDLKKYLIARISDAEKKPSSTYEDVHKFGVDQSESSWHSESNASSRIMYSYKYLRLVETAGYPFGHSKFLINEDWLKVATASLFEFMPTYVFRVLVRSCSKNATIHCFSRKNILSLPVGWADQQYAIYQTKIDDYLQTDSRSNIIVKVEDVLLPGFARLASRLDLGYSQDLSEQMLKCYNLRKRGYDQKLLAIIHDNLFAQGRARANFGLFLAKPEDELNYLPWSNKWITVTPVPNEAIDNAIASLRKIKDVDKERVIVRLWYMLSADITAEQRSKIEDAIRAWRGNVSSLKLMDAILNTYKLVKYKKNKDVRDEYYYLAKVVDSVGKRNVDTVERNMVLRNFADDCYKLSYFAGSLVASQHGILITQLCKLLNKNEEILKVDDSKSFMGGFRRELHYLLIQFTKYIANSNLSGVDKNDMCNLQDVCVRYLNYHAATIAIIAQLNNYTNHIDKSEIIEYVAKSLVHGSYYEYIEGLQAVRIIRDKKTQTYLVKIVFDYAKYSLNYKTKHFVDTISSLIIDKKISKSQWLRPVDDILNSIANTMVDFSGEEELRMDMMYNSNMLAGVVNALWGETEGVARWRQITQDRCNFNDVRIGFDIGQSRAIKDNDKLFEMLVLVE